MKPDDYRVVLYRSQPDAGVAEIRAIAGCYPLMPTRKENAQEIFAVLVTPIRKQTNESPS